MSQKGLKRNKGKVAKGTSTSKRAVLAGKLGSVRLNKSYFLADEGRPIQVYIQKYQLRYIPEHSSENLEEYLSLTKKLYERGILSNHWQHKSDAKLEDNQRYQLISDNGLVLNCSLEWKLADKNEINEIGIGIIERLLNNESTVKTFAKTQTFNLSKEDISILRKSKLYDTLFASLKRFSNGLINEVQKKNYSLSAKESLSEFKSKEADEFATAMGQHIEEARNEGFVSTRKIAEYLNRRSIKSALGGKWSASAVSNLLKRRRKLGLEGEISEKVKAHEEKRRNLPFTKSMGEHLEKVRKEGYTTTRAIASRFNELGVKTKTGKDWSNVTVHKLIQKRQEFGLE